MMNEITMPIDLASAVSMLSGGDMQIPVMTAESGGAVFGEILGQLMGGSDDNASDALMSLVPNPNAEAAQILPEKEESPADAVAAMLTGDENAELPEVFDFEGAQAFMKTLDRFLDGKFDVKDVKKLWENVPEEEKAAFAELLETVFTQGEFRISDADGEEETFLADQSLKAVAAMVMKTAKRRPEDKEKPDEDDALKAYFMQGMNFVSFADSNETPLTETVQTEAPVQVGAVTAETADIPEANEAMVIEKDIPEREELSEEGNNEIIVDKKDNFSENIQNVYEKISKAEPEEIVSFCKALGEELKAEVAQTTEVPENAQTYRFEDGRQAVMARVNRPFEEQTDKVRNDPLAAQITAEQEVQQTTQTSIIPEREHLLPKESDISSQIMERIDLYGDIMKDSFTEREITMKLSPEELGGLEIKIRRSGSGIEVRFTAEKPEAAQLIGDKASQLAEAVASRGIKLKEMYVSERIVTNESSRNFTDSGSAHQEGFYGSNAQREDNSGRKFTFGGDMTAVEISDSADESVSEDIYNREAKLWVSA